MSEDLNRQVDDRRPPSLGVTVRSPRAAVKVGCALMRSTRQRMTYWSGRIQRDYPFNTASRCRQGSYTGRQSVKHNDSWREPVKCLEHSIGSDPGSRSMALNRHRPLWRQFVSTDTLTSNCTVYMRDHLVKGHDGQIDEVRRCRLLLHQIAHDVKKSKETSTHLDCAPVVGIL